MFYSMYEAEMIIDFGGCSWDIRHSESRKIPTLSVNRSMWQSTQEHMYILHHNATYPLHMLLVSDVW